MGKENLLELKGISKSFSGVTVLNNINFLLKSGSVHALVGENGAGKSTLIKCLSGIYIPDEGEIYLKGEKEKFNNPLHALNKGIAVIHQELTPVLERTVMENIWLGKEPKKGPFVNKKQMYSDTKELMERLELNISPSELMKNLSIAQIQMVEIAKAISRNANIVVMDEPTSSLTNNEVRQLFKIIKQLKEADTGIIYISHKMDEIYEISDEITVLRDGQHIITEKASDVSAEEVINQMVGRELKDLFPKENVPQKEKILEVKKLSDDKSFNDISFELYKGEILGVAGLAGAGRSEVMEAIFGIRKKSGQVLVKGKEVEIHCPTDAINHGIAFLTEDRRNTGIVPMLSVGYNMLVANFKKYQKKNGLLNQQQMKEDTSEYMKKLNVKARSSAEEIQNLSGGNQQKVLVARWLLTNPEILVLDEPTRGIDIGAKSEIYKMISDLAKEGKAIIMISSELPEILGMSDRVMVVHEGHIQDILDIKDCSQERLMQLATGNL